MLTSIEFIVQRRVSLITPPASSGLLRPFVDLLRLPFGLLRPLCGPQELWQNWLIKRFVLTSSNFFLNTSQSQDVIETERRPEETDERRKAARGGRKAAGGFRRTAKGGPRRPKGGRRIPSGRRLKGGRRRPKGGRRRSTNGRRRPEEAEGGRRSN